MAKGTEVIDGVEVGVETGTGVVVKFDHEPGKRNALVQFRATHTNLKDPVGGWLDTFRADDVALIQQALTEGRVLEYRVEIRRKADADPATPIADLKPREKVRDLASVKPVGAGAANPPASAPDSPPQPPRGAPAPDTAPDAPAASQGAPERRARVAEAPPYQLTNSDGTPNLGSYAVTAGAGMVDLAVELILAATPTTPLRPSTIAVVAGDLMAAADAVQVEVCGGVRPDRNANSHTRARGLLRTAMRAKPYPVAHVIDAVGGKLVDGHESTREGWSAKVIPAAAGLLRIAIDLSGVA